MRNLLVVISLILLTTPSAFASVKDCKRLKLEVYFFDSHTGEHGIKLNFDGNLLSHEMDSRYRTIDLRESRDLYSWVILNKDGLAAKITDVLDMIDYRHRLLSVRDKQSLDLFKKKFDFDYEIQLEPDQLGDRESYNGATDESLMNVRRAYDSLNIKYTYYRCK